MPRNAFPFARHPVEGVPHGSTLAVGPSPFSGAKGRMTAPTNPTTANIHWWGDANDYSKVFVDNPGVTPVSADAQTVACWKDSNGGLVQLEQNTAGNRPAWRTNILNGKAGIKFDGTTDVMSWSSVLTAAIMDNSTVFMVLSGWTPGAFQGVLGSTLAAGNDSYYLRVNDDNNLGLLEAGVAGVGTSTTGYSTAGAVMGVVFTQTTSYAFYNGRSLNGSGSTTSTITASGTLVGAQLGVVERYTGYIHELIIYSAVLNAAQIDTTAWYLMGKWGVTS
jgi:hypothetical protein